MSTTSSTSNPSGRSAPTRSRKATVKLPDPLPAAVMQDVPNALIDSAEVEGVPDENAAVKERLAELEGLIREGIRQYRLIGKHLEEIRAEKLWRFEGNGSFNEYCHRVFGFGEKRASQLIAAGRRSTDGRRREAKNERQSRNRESASAAVCSWCESRVNLKRLNSTVAAIEALPLDGAEVGGVAHFGLSDEALAALPDEVKTLDDLRRLVDDPDQRLPGVGSKTRERIGEAITDTIDRLLHELHGINRVKS